MSRLRARKPLCHQGQENRCSWVTAEQVCTPVGLGLPGPRCPAHARETWYRESHLGHRWSHLWPGANVGNLWLFLDNVFPLPVSLPPMFSCSLPTLHLPSLNQQAFTLASITCWVPRWGPHSVTSLKNSCTLMRETNTKPQLNNILN